MKRNNLILVTLMSVLPLYSCGNNNSDWSKISLSRMLKIRDNVVHKSILPKHISRYYENHEMISFGKKYNYPINSFEYNEDEKYFMVETGVVYSDPIRPDVSFYVLDNLTAYRLDGYYDVTNQKYCPFRDAMPLKTFRTEEAAISYIRQELKNHFYKSMMFIEEAIEEIDAYIEYGKEHPGFGGGYEFYGKGKDSLRIKEYLQSYDSDEDKHFNRSVEYEIVDGLFTYSNNLEDDGDEGHIFTSNDVYDYESEPHKPDNANPTDWKINK